MAQDFLNLKWRVHTDGYEVVETDPPEDWPEKWPHALIRPINPSGNILEYNISEHPNLFRSFADIGCKTNNTDLALAFANEYGFQLSFDGEEHLFEWALNASHMADVIEIWNAATNENVEALKKYITLDSDSIEIHSHQVRSEIKNQFGQKTSIDTISKSEFLDDIGTTWPKTLIEAAYCSIAYYINYGLELAITPGIFPNKYNTGLEFILAPSNLKKALWLQIAFAILRNAQFRKCMDVGCFKYFEISAKKRRYEKQYCSDKCRKRAERRRKRNERSLKET